MMYSKLAFQRKNYIERHFSSQVAPEPYSPKISECVSLKNELETCPKRLSALS